MTNAFNYEVEQYLNEYGKFFDTLQMDNIKAKIISSNKTMNEIKSLKLKSPTTATVLAVCLGWLGADRFYNGNYILGLIKLLTGGIYFIGWIVDIFLIGKSVRNKNLDKLYSLLTGQEADRKITINADTIKNVVTNKDVQTAIKDLKKSCKNLRDTMDINNNF